MTKSCRSVTSLEVYRTFSEFLYNKTVIHVLVLVKASDFITVLTSDWTLELTKEQVIFWIYPFFTSSSYILSFILCIILQQ